MKGYMVPKEDMPTESTMREYLGDDHWELGWKLCSVDRWGQLSSFCMCGDEGIQYPFGEIVTPQIKMVAEDDHRMCGPLTVFNERYLAVMFVRRQYGYDALDTRPQWIKHMIVPCAYSPSEHRMVWVWRTNSRFDGVKDEGLPYGTRYAKAVYLLHDPRVEVALRSVAEYYDDVYEV